MPLFIERHGRTQAPIIMDVPFKAIHPLDPIPTSRNPYENILILVETLHDERFHVLKNTSLYDAMCLLRNGKAGRHLARLYGRDLIHHIRVWYHPTNTVSIDPSRFRLLFTKYEVECLLLGAWIDETAQAARVNSLRRMFGNKRERWPAIFPPALVDYCLTA